MVPVTTRSSSTFRTYYMIIGQPCLSLNCVTSYVEEAWVPSSSRASWWRVRSLHHHSSAAWSTISVLTPRPSTNSPWRPIPLERWSLSCERTHCIRNYPSVICPGNRPWPWDHTITRSRAFCFYQPCNQAYDRQSCWFSLQIRVNLASVKLVSANLSWDLPNRAFHEQNECLRFYRYPRFPCVRHRAVGLNP